MVKITMLNSMASTDFVQSLDTQKAWGIKVLDLKDEIFGKSIADLTTEQAEIAAKLIRERELSVYCFSTQLFHDDMEIGEEQFRDKHVSQIQQMIQTAQILKPSVIRLLAARTLKRSEVDHSVRYIKEQHPWLIECYREAIDRITAAGFQVTIENECDRCIFSTLEEISEFFEELNRPIQVTFTYDVTNLWEMGTYPSVELYEKLKPLIGYFHVKGGIKQQEGTELQWKSALEDASWPVTEITQWVVNDGISPIICMNPSHGKAKERYDYENLAKRDLDFLRENIAGVE